MKELVIKLDDNYNIPTNINRMTSAEWEIIIDYASKLLLKHDVITAKINESEIQQLTEHKYRGNIDLLEGKIAEYEKEITSVKNNIPILLKKQRKEIEEQYRIANAELLEPKDTTIKQLKQQINDYQTQISSLHEQMESDYKNKLKKLNDEITCLETKYEDKIKKITQDKDNIESKYENKIIKYEEKFSNYDDKISMIHSQHRTELNQVLEQESIKTKELLAKAASEKRELENKFITELNEANKQHSIKMQEALNQANDQSRERLKEAIEQINIKQSLLQNSIIQKLEPITKFYGGSNIEKGNSGENSIREVLSTTDIYNNALIEDVSGIAGSGDIIFTFNNLKCLIEIKNKAKITTDDMDKFTRDVKQSKESGTINCAMLLSLQSKQFPGRSRKLLQLDYISGTPVIYSYIPPPADGVHFAVVCLESALQPFTGNSEEHELLQKHFVDYYSNVIEMQKYFDQELKKKQKEIKTINKHLLHMNKLCEELSPVYTRITNSSQEDNPSPEDDPSPQEEEDDDPSSSSSSSSTTNNITLSDDPDERLNQLSEIYIALCIKGTPTSIASISDASGVSKKIIEYIGFKKIDTHAKQLYLSQIINTSRLEKITEFYNTNERYPTRKELTTKKIFPDHILRNIIKVTKQKKVTTAIESYITNNTEEVVDES